MCILLYYLVISNTLILRDRHSGAIRHL